MSTSYITDERMIINEIIEILYEKFDIYIEKNMINLNIFNSKIGITCNDMLYLIKILEKKYNIFFNEHDIDNENFFNIDGLSYLINKKLYNMH